MRFKVKNFEEADEPTLTFEIISSEDEIKLICVDDIGRRWNVLWINRKGMLCRCEKLSNNIGLQVDDKGRIKLEK